MRDYASVSFWLETSGDDLSPRPSLPGPRDTDIAILGGGYSGLWTAYYLLKRYPGLRVVILERHIVGYGASGRNGAWCSDGFPVGPAMLQRWFGRDAARAVQLAMRGAVDEVGAVCAREGIDAHFVKGGAMRVARGRHELPIIQGAYETYKSLQLGDHCRLLDRNETRDRVQITDAYGALFTQDCAVIHPGRLVRGLARVVERMGATIYEQTDVTGFGTNPQPQLSTTEGDVRANTIVLAGEAYLTRLSQLHRQLLPLYSLITLTEPLSHSVWNSIGWKGRECISSNRYTVDYLSRTQDDRLLFGSRGAPYRLGSRIDDSSDRHAPTHKAIRNMAIEWFPQLAESRFTHSWGGPVGMPRDWMPVVSYDRATGLGTARGYTGQGVSTTNLFGQILADLITEAPLDRWSSLPFVGHRSPDWEPEPFRWLGIRYMQAAYERIDRRARRTGHPPSGRSLAERLGRH